MFSKLFSVYSLGVFVGCTDRRVDRRLLLSVVISMFLRCLIVLLLPFFVWLNHGPYLWYFYFQRLHFAAPTTKVSLTYHPTFVHPPIGLIKFMVFCCLKTFSLFLLWGERSCVYVCVYARAFFNNLMIYDVLFFDFVFYGTLCLAFVGMRCVPLFSCVLPFYSYFNVSVYLS